MEPGLNRTYRISPRRGVFMQHELAAAMITLFGLFAGLRPLTRWLFGRPMVTPLVSIMLGGACGAVVLASLYGWRMGDHDRPDYLYLAFRKWRTGGRGAYNPLDRQRRLGPRS